MRGSATRARRLGTYLPPLRRRRRDLPPELGRAIDLALRPRPRERGTIAELRAGLAASLDRLDDTPGLLAAPLAPHQPVPLLFTPAPDPPPGDPHAGRLASTPRRAGAPRPSRRVAGSILAGAAAAWLATRCLSPAPVGPVLAGALAAIAVFLLPRVGWLLAAIGLAGAAAAAGHAGVALLILVALPLPALRPPGPSAVARGWLGGCCWLWLAVAVPLTGHALLIGVPPGTLAPRGFAASLTLTVHGVLVPLARSGALAGAAVCAVMAVTGPWLARLSSPAVRLVLTCSWAAAGVCALPVIISASAASGAAATLHHTVPVAMVAAAAVFAPSLYPGPRGSAGAPDRPGAPRELS